jgi:hypothetical protein
MMMGQWQQRQPGAERRVARCDLEDHRQQERCPGQRRVHDERHGVDRRELPLGEDRQGQHRRGRVALPDQEDGQPCYTEQRHGEYGG